MIRIISGEFKGKRLKVPNSARPITDRIKTTIFDLIRDYVQDAKVLDLFSGSGNFAIEALSRGAAKSIIVEIEDKAIKIIKDNIYSCKLNLKTEIFKCDVIDFLKRSLPNQFDIIMVDPPFKVHVSNKQRIINLCLNHLSPAGVLVFRCPSNENYTTQLKNADIVYNKKMGSSKLFFIVKKQST